MMKDYTAIFWHWLLLLLVINGGIELCVIQLQAYTL
jgi:hypothetical protein